MSSIAPSESMGSPHSDAPSERRSNELQQGDVVLASLRGFPDWPGRIVQASKLPRRIQQLRDANSPLHVCVQFFDAGDCAFIRKEDVRLLTSEMIESWLASATKVAGRHSQQLVAGYKTARNPKRWIEADDCNMRRELELDAERERRKALWDSRPAPPAAASTSSSSASTGAAAVSKRPVGRPPKNPPVDGAAAKRPVGRPRKHPLPVVEGGAGSSSSKGSKLSSSSSGPPVPVVTITKRAASTEVISQPATKRIKEMSAPVVSVAATSASSAATAAAAAVAKVAAWTAHTQASNSASLSALSPVSCPSPPSSTLSLPTPAPTATAAATTSATTAARPAVVHRSVMCDSCSATPIVGPRTRCTVCPGIDLCEDCARNHDGDHVTWEINEPLVIHRVPCGGCDKIWIEGTRFLCARPACNLVSFCAGCKSSHTANHALVPVKQAVTGEKEKERLMEGVEAVRRAMGY